MRLSFTVPRRPALIPPLFYDPPSASNCFHSEAHPPAAEPRSALLLHTSRAAWAKARRSRPLFQGREEEVEGVEEVKEEEEGRGGGSK